MYNFSMYCKKCGKLLAIRIMKNCIRCRFGGLDNIIPLIRKHGDHTNWETESSKKGYRDKLENPDYDKA